MGERDEFLVNPYGLLHGEVTASSLVRVGRDGAILDGGSTSLGVDISGLLLHSALYGARRDVHCIMHLHTVAGAAVGKMHIMEAVSLVQSCWLFMLSGVSNELWSIAIIRGSTECESHIMLSQKTI